MESKTYEELNGFVREGRIGPDELDVRFWLDNPKPEAGETVWFCWDFLRTMETLGILRMPGMDGVGVLPNGRCQFEVGGDIVPIELEVAGRIFECVVNPQVSIPIINNFECANSKAFIGEAVSVVWNAEHAVSCLLIVRDGDEIREKYLSETSGEISVYFKKVGSQSIQLKAFGRHSHVVHSAVADEEILITVVSPPVDIFVPRKHLSAYPGQEVVFEWEIESASKVVVEASDRGETFDAPMQGKLIVEVGACKEWFRLVVADLEDTEHVVDLSVTPKLLNITDTPEVLKSLSSI